jgi:hypothetical protein
MIGPTVLWVQNQKARGKRPDLPGLKVVAVRGLDAALFQVRHRRPDLVVVYRADKAETVKVLVEASRTAPVVPIDACVTDRRRAMRDTGAYFYMRLIEHPDPEALAVTIAKLAHVWRMAGHPTPRRYIRASHPPLIPPGRRKGAPSLRLVTR